MLNKPSKNGRPDNFAAAVTEVSERMSVLVREEIELAKAEVSQKVTSMVKGAVAVAAGAVFGVFAIIFGFATAAWGLNSLLNSLWLGFVIVFGVLLVATIGTFMFARNKLKVGVPTPTMAIDEAKKIRETVSASTNGGDSAVAKAAEAVKAEAEASS
ncbi:MAG TPA: phage holin family protein [Solirubrobacteraceae bacterium]|nr:phage holin family protein [Solirubrobacteraceae bacterium]